jgi:hypothetical protein
MKSFFALATASVALCIGLTACSSKQSFDPNADATKAPATSNSHALNAARLAGPLYSQSIQIDSANYMIASYLESVGYPAVDSAIRTLSFDADTLRAYLANPSITTMRFYFGHQQSYLAGGPGRFGGDVGMRPGALTIIAVGINDAGQVVRNSSNGVYEHAMPCPYSCALEVDAYLH